MTLLLLLLLCLAQGKLEPEARQLLIAKGQQVKQQLEEIEAKLLQVSVNTDAASITCCRRIIKV